MDRNPRPALYRSLAAWGAVDAWSGSTVMLCRERSAFPFDLTANEWTVFDGAFERGEIDASLLDIAPEIGVRAEGMPMLASIGG